MVDWNTDIYDKIVRQIYEAASDPEIWNETINAIGDHLDFGVIHLMLVSYETGFEYLATAPREDPEFAEEYLRNYAREDFRQVRIFSRPSGVAFDERVIVSEEEKRNSPIHQELFPRHKIYNIMGSNMSIGDSQGWFGVTTRKASEDFTDEQREAFQRLLPHVLQSMHITKTNVDLQVSRSLAYESIDHVKAGVFLFVNGQLANVNRTGKAILKDGYFTIANGALACRQPIADRRLQEYLKKDNGILDQPLIMRDRPSEAEYCVRRHDPAPHFSQGRFSNSANQLISITKLRGLSAPVIGDVEDFAGAYGLSEAEIHVLLAVLRHEELKELAETRGVSLDTVRKQLKSAMAKMAVSSQKELFRMYERFRLMSV